MINKVFVYGTLKETHGLHGALDGAKSIGVGFVRGYLFHLGQFPALVLADRGPPAYGEVYESNTELIDKLDKIEGHPNFYYRVAIRVGGYGPCWAYAMPMGKAIDRTNLILKDGTWLGPVDSKTQGYYSYVNDHPDFGTPNKPHTVFDPVVKEYVINQTVPMHPSSSRAVVVAAPGPYKGPQAIVVTPLPPEPEEAGEALKGMQVGWA